MRHFDDPFISCPLNNQHRMPSLKLQWHLAKCKKQFWEKYPGRTIYHCKYNYLHIYLDKSEILAHEMDACPDKPKLLALPCSESS
jgi:hypothetical protein